MVQCLARRNRRCRVRRRPAAFEPRPPGTHAPCDLLGRRRRGGRGVSRCDERPLRTRQSDHRRRSRAAHFDRGAGIARLPVCFYRDARKRFGDVGASVACAGYNRRAPARRRQFHSANGTAKRRLRRGTRYARKSANDHAAGRFGVSFAGALDGASANDRRNRLALRFVHRSGRRTRR